MICASTHDDEEIAIMIDSGASETVAPFGRFSGQGRTTTTATGTVHSSASAIPSEDITNIGEKMLEAIDQNAVGSHAKFQMC